MRAAGAGAVPSLPGAALGRMALLSSVFVVYGSLLPWQWQARPLADALAGYLGLGQPLQPSIPDVLTNLIIYAILGLLWMAGRRPDGAGGRQERQGWHGWQRGLTVLIGCSGLSAAIEFAQLFVPQRSSSISDWLANTAGAGLGVLAAVWLAPQIASWLAAGWRLRQPPRAASRALRLGLGWLALPYLAALAWANHWRAGDWRGWDAAAGRWAQTQLLPFYYHQEASTVMALNSALWTLLLYAPIGIFVGAFASPARPPRAGQPRSAALACALAGGLALVMGLGRLFVPGQHLDLGDVLIAPLGAWLGAHLLLPWLMAALLSAQGQPPQPQQDPPGQPPQRPPQTRMAAAKPAADSGGIVRALSLLLLAAVFVALLRFPVLTWWLVAGFALYAAALRRWPAAWLVVLPALLPVLDLAPLSGRFFLDEFDLAVLLTLAMAGWTGARGQVSSSSSNAHPATPLALPRWWSAFALSVAISALIGLWPLPALDAHAFASEYSHFNALRIAKGFAWAYALALLLSRSRLAPERAGRWLGAGIVTGLAGVCALVIWERATYPGLLDFASGHRVGALMSSMHNGGSHIEAYLAMAVPFALLAIVRGPGLLPRLGASLLFALTTYVLMVTYARGGYAAYALAVVVAGLMFWHQRLRSGGSRCGGLLLLLAGALASIGVALAVGGGSFAQQRLAQTEADLGTRQAHWRETLRIMDPGPVTALFGMGLGRFPQSYFFRNDDGQALATFRYVGDGLDSHLTLGQGEVVYVEQFVDVQPGRDYRLSLELRGTGAPVNFNVLLCARTYFASYGCESATLVAEAGSSGWRRLEATIASGVLGQGNWLSRRPVKLSLENARPGTVVDVRGITLAEAGGSNLVANGSFADGSDHWFYSSIANHLPWHVKNLAVGLYFDQGGFGLTLFALLLVQALGVLALRGWRGDAYAAAALASALGFLGVGLFDSLFDAPRLITLLMLTLAVCGARRGAVGAVPLQSAVGPQASPAVWPHAASPAEPGGVRAALPDAPAPAAWLAWRQAGLALALTALAAAAVPHLPGLPYNLAALWNPRHPVLAPVALALALFWALGLPALAARWLDRSRRPVLLWPGLVLLQAGLGWALTRQAVPPALINKLAGAPILGWPWEWETLLRFGALQAALFLLLTGGCLLTRVLLRAASVRALGVWLGWAAVFAPLLYWGIVTMAATDNLTELMADNAGPGGATLLALWGVLMGATSALLALPPNAARVAPWARWGWLLLSAPLGLALLWLGLESAVLKYGTQFAALQFLLSASREAYASGWELALRYLVFHALFIGATALAQRPLRPLIR